MQRIYLRVLKRFMDIAFSAVALLLLSPLLLTVALAIYLEDGRPIIFRQLRSGANERQFKLLKFRSMPINTESVPSDKARSLAVTRIGKWIRRANLDELPQLINILKGNMSVVGPRPALASQTVLLKLRRENGAVSLKPGLTGLAQVNSYDGMPEEEKAGYDGVYVLEVSFVTDMVLILRTFRYLMRPPPVY